MQAVLHPLACCTWTNPYRVTPEQVVSLLTVEATASKKLLFNSNKAVLKYNISLHEKELVDDAVKGMD